MNVVDPALTTSSAGDAELSVVLVAYRSRADLERCLPTLHTDGLRVDVVVVDNFGQDGLRDWLATAYPAVRYVPNGANTGYAGGNNLGLRYVVAPYTLIANPDTEWPAGSLRRLLDTARQQPDALVTPKLLCPNGRLNACGNQMHYTGITTCRGLGQPATTYSGVHAVPLLSGAAVLAPTATWRALGGFDERYFLYFEDTDLSLRARLLGYRLLCHGDAPVTHHYVLALSPDKFYYVERNRLLTFLKIFDRSTLLRLLPALLLTELATWAFALRGPRYVVARFRTYAYLLRHWTDIRQYRHVVQPARQRPDADLLRDATTSLPLEQLAGNRVARWLNRLTTPVYRWLRPTTFGRRP